MGSLKNLCRLCSIKIEPSSGFDIFLESEDKASLVILINKYLPIKVAEDAILPKIICEPCHLGVATAVDLIDRMVEGQQKLRLLWNHIMDAKRLSIQCDEEEKSFSKEPLSTLIDIQGKTPEIEMDDLAKGVNIKKVYEKHPLINIVEGNTPKKKRGRPKKGEAKPRSTNSKLNSIQLDAGRPRRKAALPFRYRDSLVEKDDGTSGDDDDPEGLSNEPPFLNALSSSWEGLLPSCDKDSLSIDSLAKSDVQLNTLLDGNTVIITQHHESLPGVPATVNIEIDFQEGQDVNSNEALGSFVPPPKASVYAIEPVVREQPPKILKRYKFPPPRKRRHQKNKWLCEYCQKGFLHKGRYVCHIRRHKTSIFECNDCQEKFISREDLNLHHMQFEHTAEVVIEVDKGSERPPLNCPFCLDRSFHSLENYDAHIMAIHEKQKPFSCSYCKKRFAFRQSLKSHYALHEPGKEKRCIPCSICSRVFNSQSSLMYHKATSHSDGRKFSCSLCPSAFFCKQSLSKHVSSVHSEERPFECALCEKKFKTKSNLGNHMSNSHSTQKRFTCETCAKQFNHPTSFQVHLRIHTGEKPFACIKCGKTFTQKGNLKEHERIHTGEKPFCCSHCAKRFKTSSQLRLHEKMHNKEPKFKCALCPKAFAERNAWLKHEGEHKGTEEPWMCDLCADSFKDKMDLAKHVKSHMDSAEKNSPWLLPSLPSSSSLVDMNSLESNFIYVITKKNEEELVPFEEVIFATDQDQCVKGHLSLEDGSRLTSDGTNRFTNELSKFSSDVTDGNLQNTFVCEPSIDGIVEKVVASSDLTVGSQSFDLPLRNGSIFSVVLPDTEDSSLYMRKMFESAGIPQ